MVQVMSGWMTKVTSLDLKMFRCTFCDLRVEETHKSNIFIQNGELVSANDRPSLGFFIRVFNRGKWYYQSATDFDKIPQYIYDLIKLSETMPVEENQYVPPKDQGNHFLLKYDQVAVKNISLDKKLALVKSYLPLVDKIEFLKESRLRYADMYMLKYYKNSAGTSFAYDFNQAGFAFGGTLKKGDSLFTDGHNEYSANFTSLHNLDEKILKHFQEAKEFLDAKTVSPGKYRVVLSPEMVGVFTHESFGHKSEADFMLGDPEATKEWQMGKKVGASILSIVDSGAHLNTSGYCPIDDEGTPAKKNYLIKNGILSGRLHTTITAQALGEEATGNCRAMNFEFEPIVRMTSTYIEPGSDSLEDVFRKAGDGALYFDGVKHGTGGSTFTIAPTRAYLIKDGKLHEPVRVSVISGSVFETLNNIEAISNDFDLKSSAFGGCGKMEQFPLPVADGGPSILVNGMQVS